MSIRERLANYYWNNSFLSSTQKEKIIFFIRRKLSKTNKAKLDKENIKQYLSQIFQIPNAKSDIYYKSLIDEPYVREKDDIKLFAYYLTQMYPTPENDRWWGKGTTEWNNVSRAVPQFVGHYQPKLPGELGFYDLRLKENINRQIELAKMYGVYGFCFYYYWFDGKRMLDKPLDLFVNSKDLSFPFCLCWANESWRSTFSSGSAETILMEQSRGEASYKNFIKDISTYLKDDRYFKINDKKVIVIYRPHDVPNPRKTIAYWRDYCRENDVGEIYIIACWRRGEEYDFIKNGFDAASEFHPGSLPNEGKSILNELKIINNNFYGKIFDYSDLVNTEMYSKNYNKEKLYNSVFPMWDNTPRRNDKGGVVYHNSNPLLYKKWLKNVIAHNYKRKDTDDCIAFINAWNEWGEGAYLEPDKYYGYAYLNATKEAIEESRK